LVGALRRRIHGKMADLGARECKCLFSFSLG